MFGCSTCVWPCYIIAIFVRPDSPIHCPEDLKDVLIAVRMRAGSHFNVPYRLEKYLPLEHIKTGNVGGFGARLKAPSWEVRLKRQVCCRHRSPWQNSSACEKSWTIDSIRCGGFRRPLRPRSCTDTFALSIERRRRLRLICQDICFCGNTPCHPNLRLVPWDFSRFGRGERFVYEPISRQEFAEVFEQVKPWGLDQFIKERNFENLAAQTDA